MKDNQEILVALMQDMFQLNQKELDFGIYRLMNSRRDIINAFIEGLPSKIDAILKQSFVGKASAEVEQIKEDIKKTESDTSFDDVLKATIIAAKKKRLSELEGDADIAAETDAIYEHLVKFFKMYYNEGDFISQRKYGKDQYAIPYAGEEVKLYWANADQYYIKTAENFNLYTFDTGFGKAHFRIVNMHPSMLPKNNNKDVERRFSLVEGTQVEDDEGVKEYRTFEVIDGELYINFYYEKSKTQQASLIREAIEILSHKLPAEYAYLLNGQAGSSMLEKRLKDYVARNTFDYFIHKDLKAFLTRELDNYIKNEILTLDNLLASEEKQIANVEKAKAIRAIAMEIIDFLASLEDFQKKLWEKKKFVYETNYCITLDRIAESFYAEIAANDAQREEWVRLYAINEIEATAGTLLDTGTVAYSVPLTVDFLHQNPFLMLDTAFFNESFKERLIETIDDLDEHLDGLLIHSENYQALSLLQNKYHDKIGCIYIDPPYNSDASPIMYKNGYKDSSWCSLLYDRLISSKSLLNSMGICVAAIDDAELSELCRIMRQAFCGTLLGTFCVRANPSGRPTQTGYSVSHEYLLASGKTEKSIIGKMPPTEQQMRRFNNVDENGKFEWRNLRREGSNSDRSARRGLYYPIYLTSATLRVPAMEWNDIEKEWIILEQPSSNEVAVYPNNDAGIEKTWRWEPEKVRTSMKLLSVRPDRTGKNYVYYKRYSNEDGVVTVSSWFDAKYSSTEHGTALLKDLYGTSLFSYPKSIYAVEDAIYVSGMNVHNSVCLDYFAGSGTTGHAVINLNREYGGNRKYILVEMGEYFNTVTKPRIEKVVYSMDAENQKGWKDGKPVSRKGSSQAFKYIRLEGYEDTLNNLPPAGGVDDLTTLPRNDNAFTVKYLFDYTARGGKSLLNIDDLNRPFEYKMQIVDRQQYTTKVIDLVETFNYLIGLYVEKSYARVSFDADFAAVSEALHATIREGAAYQIKAVTGTSMEDGHTLVVWRNITDDIGKSNAVLDAYLSRFDMTQFDTIYVNGSYSLPDENNAKIKMTDACFFSRMFEEQ